ncbi:hypothetical protein [Acidovorax citrulli]|nr:hypothetical protein [Paracidovorax citrulli]MVT30159.1 hypothetical protein [Paracidovorax citrulli]QCX12178.1 hypothetical protein APS58_3420 [Paracidovorax citrulli]SDK14544.1 hypothetical protein SAMN04489709_1123 [Paracidovorax citrulli]
MGDGQCAAQLAADAMPAIHVSAGIPGQGSQGETWNTTKTTDNYNYGASG